MPDHYFSAGAYQLEIISARAEKGLVYFTTTSHLSHHQGLVVLNTQGLHVYVPRLCCLAGFLRWNHSEMESASSSSSQSRSQDCGLYECRTDTATGKLCGIQ